MAERTPCSVKLRRLHLDAPMARILEQAAADGHDADEATTYRYAIADSCDGGVHLVTHEGVGEHVPPDGSAEIPWWLSTTAKDGTPSTFGMFPEYETVLSCRELRVLAGEEVRLEDFIRTFGARLERNYELWRETLEEDRKAQEAYDD